MAWYNTSWKSRIKITIANGKVDADLTDFPVYVDLSDLPSSFWSSVLNGGGDIRITRSDGTTECAREIVKCDTSDSTGELHFLANSLSNSTDTEFYIYFQNSGASEPGASATYGSQNVWSNYTAVYHCAQQPNGANTILDSTANANHMSSNNMETSDRVAGKFTWGLDFGGTNEYLQRAAVLFDTPAFSVSCWVKSSVTNQGMGLISCGDTAGTSNEQCLFLSTAPTPNPAVNAFTRATTTSSVYATSAYSANTWFSAHGVWSAANSRTAYMNGGNAATETTSKTPSGLDTTSIGCRTRSTLDSYLTATLSEIRIRPSALTSTWISTEYNNQSSPATFYTLSSHERFIIFDSGSYTYTGVNHNLLYNKNIYFDSGVYTYTGNNVNFLRTYICPIDTGAYTYTGYDLNGLRGYGISFNYGSYTYTGNNYNLLGQRKISVDNGNYTYAGNNYSILAQRKLGVDTGNYVYTGNDILFDLVLHRILTLETGSYSTTGIDIGLRGQFKISPVTGEYLLNGNTIGLKAGRKASIELGTYALTGNSFNLTTQRKLDIVSGDYDLIGNEISLLIGKKITVEAGNYIIDEQDFNFSRTYVLSFEKGEYILNGQNFNLLSGRLFNFEKGTYQVTGNNISLKKGYLIQFDNNSYIITGSDIAFGKGYGLQFETGDYDVTGNNIDFIYTRVYRIDIETGEYTVTGNKINLLAPAKVWRWTGVDWEPVTGIKILG